MHTAFNMTSNRELVDEQLAAMLLQEKKFYQCSAYLETCSSSSEPPVPTVCPLQILNEMASIVTDRQFVRLESSSSIESGDDSDATPTAVVDDIYENHEIPKRQSQRDKLELSLIATWRHQMFDWVCQVVRCKCLNKGVVEVSFNILDRFVAMKLEEQSISRGDFQLYCLVAVYIAFKTSASAGRLTLKHLISMAGGVYQSEDFHRAELEMLETLQWRVNPPTIMTFCDVYLSLDEAQLSENVYSVCEYMAEVAVADEFFISKPCSTIALGIVLLAARKEGVKFAWTQNLLQELRGLVFVEGDEFESILQQLKHLS